MIDLYKWTSESKQISIFLYPNKFPREYSFLLLNPGTAVHEQFFWYFCIDSSLLNPKERYMDVLTSAYDNGVYKPKMGTKMQRTEGQYNSSVLVAINLIEDVKTRQTHCTRFCDQAITELLLELTDA